MEILALGRRRRLLEETFEKMLEEDFENRVVPFDTAAAKAAARKATIATRNVRHFEQLNLDVTDPWSK